MRETEVHTRVSPPSPAASHCLPEGCLHLPVGRAAPLPANGLRETKSCVRARPLPQLGLARARPLHLLTSRSPPAQASRRSSQAMLRPPAARRRGEGRGLQAAAQGEPSRSRPSGAGGGAGGARSIWTRERGRRKRAEGDGGEARVGERDGFSAVQEKPVSPAAPEDPREPTIGTGSKSLGSSTVFPNTYTCRDPHHNHLATKDRLDADRLGPGNQEAVPPRRWPTDQSGRSVAVALSCPSRPRKPGRPGSLEGSCSPHTLRCSPDPRKALIWWGFGGLLGECCPGNFRDARGPQTLGKRERKED
ncbi:hypothetical protein P7K49_033150 [Saguinus oedipus]|uniref:Uncharacterized protein n=1 Tax=Saguinus oedipus TaxID=9490 RepID=A0ABQ9TR42_SAGOE|nr:hypothetical protein P7K49_033150 [Saguinus oedipus]